MSLSFHLTICLVIDNPQLVEDQPLGELGKNPNLAARFVHLNPPLESNETLPQGAKSVNMFDRLRRPCACRNIARQTDVDDIGCGDVIGPTALETLDQPLSQDGDLVHIQDMPTSSMSHA
jgi:hypothetical protein